MKPCRVSCLSCLVGILLLVAPLAAAGETCQVPLAGGPVTCQHGACVRDQTLAALGGPTGDPLTPRLFEHADFCKCDYEFTGLACETPCPMSRGNMPCRNQHVQPEASSSEGCGQVFHREPDCVGCTAQERTSNRQRWLAANNTWSPAGLCFCPWPSLGKACEYSVDKGRMSRTPTMNDFLARQGMLSSEFQPSYAAAFINEDSGGASPYSVCGEHGRLTEAGCQCEEGWYPTTDVLGNMQSHRAVSRAGFLLPDVPQAWELSMLPVCSLSANMLPPFAGGGIPVDPLGPPRPPINIPGLPPWLQPRPTAHPPVGQQQPRSSKQASQKESSSEGAIGGKGATIGIIVVGVLGGLCAIGLVIGVCTRKQNHRYSALGQRA